MIRSGIVANPCYLARRSHLPRFEERRVFLFDAPILWHPCHHVKRHSRGILGRAEATDPRDPLTGGARPRARCRGPLVCVPPLVAA